MDKGTNKTSGIPAGVGNRINWKWIDARTLHKTLGDGSLFPNWIKRCIKTYSLIESNDYEVYFRPKGKNTGGTPKDYLLSPEIAEKLTAKHNSRIYIKSSQITIFTFGNRKLNVFRYNDELWFFGMDICSILGISNRCFVATKNEGQMTVITTLSPRYTPSRYSVMNEWGLIWYVCHSIKSGTKATEVSKWLINEALPKIRKAYAVPPSMIDRFRQFIKPHRRQPEILPLCDHPGFPINLPPKEAQDERS
jgi:prophage antirepressor-like protein